MNEFVEECRREWKRLGVPEAVASDMAAELAADLEEAEAEGASAEEVLGRGLSDPRSFAADWAAERGLVQRPVVNRQGQRRARVLAALVAFALIAVSGAVLVILASPSTPRRLTLASPANPPQRPLWIVAELSQPRMAPAPPARVITALPPSPRELGSRLVTVDIDDSGFDTRTVGSTLLTVGLAGLVPLTMFWLWLGSPRRRMQT